MTDLYLLGETKDQDEAGRFDGVPTKVLEKSGQTKEQMLQGNNTELVEEMDRKFKVLQSSWGQHRDRPRTASLSDNTGISSTIHANLAKNYKLHRLRFSGVVVRLNEVENKKRKVGQREMYSEVEAVNAACCSSSGIKPQVAVQKPVPITPSSCLIF